MDGMNGLNKNSWTANNQSYWSNRYWYTDSIRDLLLNCSFNEHSQYYALKRTRTSTLFSTRFWVSRVYHFTTKASWKWIVFHDIYLVWCMEYMTKVEYFYWSVMSYRPELDIQLLRFELSGRCLIYIISKRWTIKPISRFNRSPKRWIGSQITRDICNVKSRSDYAYS